jgi:hypothetical protein
VPGIDDVSISFSAVGCGWCCDFGRGGGVSLVIAAVAGVGNFVFGVNVVAVGLSAVGSGWCCDVGVVFLVAVFCIDISAVDFVAEDLSAVGIGWCCDVDNGDDVDIVSVAP